MKQAVAERLKELMKEKGLDVQALANASKLDEATVNAILEGASYRASMQEMVALTNALGVSLNDFTSELNVEE